MSLPTPPLRSDGPATFADRGDTFLSALPQFEIDMNAAAALAQTAITAAPGAVAAANFKGEYSAGTTYQVGHSASYGGDTWYAKTINMGVTPVVGANWQRVVAIPSQVGKSGQYLGTDGTNVSWIDSAVGNHQVLVCAGNGRGSTNTCIRRFTTVRTNVGTAIVYSDSATLGASFTISLAGIYAISYADYAASMQPLGISLNSTQLTTTVTSIAAADVLGFTYCLGNGVSNTVTVLARLSPGDVIRPHEGGVNNAVQASHCTFSVMRIGV